MRELAWMAAGRHHFVGEWLNMALGGPAKKKKSSKIKRPVSMEALCQGMGI